MLLPLGDTPNPRALPLVTWTLIALNVGVYFFVSLPLSSQRVNPWDPAVQEYVTTIARALDGALSPRAILAQASAYDLFVFEHGFRPADPALSDLLVSMFLHGGFAHLFGNMLFLWIYGDNVEHRLGPLQYLVAYLLTGAAATLTHAAIASGSELPLVGASGAISGVLGFYFLFFPRNRIKLFVFLFPFWIDVILVPARWVLGFYLLVDNLLPLLVEGATSGIARGAHVGGFVGGLAWAFAIDRLELARGGRRVQQRVPAPPQSPPTLELAQRLAAEGDPLGALSVYRRIIARERTGPLAARAHLEAGLLHQYVFHRPATAYAHYLDALDVGADPQTAARARRALSELTSA